MQSLDRGFLSRSPHNLEIAEAILRSLVSESSWSGKLSEHFDGKTIITVQL